MTPRSFKIVGLAIQYLCEIGHPVRDHHRKLVSYYRYARKNEKWEEKLRNSSDCESMATVRFYEGVADQVVEGFLQYIFDRGDQTAAGLAPWRRKQIEAGGIKIPKKNNHT